MVLALVVDHFVATKVEVVATDGGVLVVDTLVDFVDAALGGSCRPHGHALHSCSTLDHLAAYDGSLAHLVVA